MRLEGGCGIIPSAHAGVMELVDVADSKSAGLIPRVGSSPTTGTRKRGQKRFLVKKLRDFKTSEALG